MAINRFNTPAEQNLMQTYVPLPFQEMSAAAQMIQQRHDKGEVLAESLDDDLLNIKTYRELDKKYLTDYKTNLDDELSGLIKKHDGKYADMVPDLKLIQKRVNRDLTAGNLATIKSSGEQLSLYDKGVLETKKGEKYDSYLDLMLGAGGDRAQWMSEGLKNIGTETQPNYVIDDDYYDNTVVGGELSNYKYTGVWQASDMLSQLDKIYGKIKKDSQEITYEERGPDGNMRTITEKIDQISPAKIAGAALNNMNSLSPNARQELKLWSSSIGDESILAYADAFLQTLLSDEMNAATSPEDIDAINERYSNMWADMTDENGDPTQEARTYAELWNINEEGRKYITGDTNLKDVAAAKGKYKANGGSGQTHTYRIIDTGQGPEIQITPVVDEFGEDIKENSGDKLYHKWEDSVNQNYINYKSAVDEYSKWRDQTPGDVDHLADLEREMNSARYTYESNAFIRQLMTQQAALDSNYKYVGKGGTMSKPNPDGYYYNDITYGSGNQLLAENLNVGYGDTGDNIPMRYNIDVLFGDDGLPVDPSDVNAIWKFVRGRTLTDENGLVTGFAPGINEPDLLMDDPDSDDYGQIDPRTADYTGMHSTIYDSSYTGDTPLDKAKVNLYQKNKEMLFGGRTRRITELGGTGNKKADEQIRTTITENWLNDDFQFMTEQDDKIYSMVEDPAEAEALKDIISDINQDGSTNQKDVLEFLQQVKDGDVRILWESVPNSKINNGAGGYRGVVKVPTKTGAQPLYFTAPQAYLNEIMTYHVDMDGNYVQMSPNESTVKWMNYTAQIDLDKATRMPGNIVPSASSDENGNPIGYYYFGVNPNDGTPLRSDEYIFVPNKNVLTAVEVIDGQLVETRATGESSGALDVDDNTRDLARLIMLNSPDQAATKDYWYKTMGLKRDLDTTSATYGEWMIPSNEPLKKSFDKNKSPIINDDTSLIDNNINPNINEEDIIIINPNDQMPPEPIITGPPEGFDADGNRIQEEIISLEPITYDAQKFREEYLGTKDKLDELIISRENIVDPDTDTYEPNLQEDQDFNFLTNDDEGFAKSEGPGSLVITQPGDEIFPNGALMSNDYRIWDLTTGQQLDQNGKVIGPREYDHYYYQDDNGKTTHVDFSLLDGIDADGQPIDTPITYDIDSDGTIIDNDGPDEIIVPEGEDNNIEIIDENPNINTLPNSGAPNTIVQSGQTYNTTTTLRNGKVQSSTFTVKPGQVWFDDSNNVYNNWAMHRGDTMKSEPMQVKQQLLDAVNTATTTINKDFYNIFAGLYGSLGGGMLKEEATTHGHASILGWVDESGNVYDYKGLPFSSDDDTYHGSLPEGKTRDDLTLQWSDNYNETYHNRDGTVKDEYLGDRNQILNGNFPSLEMLENEMITTSDGTTGTLNALLNSGKITLMTKTGIHDPFMRNGTKQPNGNIFNIPMGDVWRSYDSQKRAYDKYIAEGGSPTAPPGTSFHEAGQAFDISQEDYDYGVYLVDISGGEGDAMLGTNAFKKTSFFSMVGNTHSAIQLDDIKFNGTRPWSGMDNEIQKLVTQRLIDMNKKDGYSLAQLSANKVGGNEWWHFSVGEMITYREPLMPGNKYGTYKYVR
tara:strand:+ start:711 stop:5465 length:4755 start_codon:yes stop_codon:yes gene_type:complete